MDIHAQTLVRCASCMLRRAQSVVAAARARARSQIARAYQFSVARAWNPRARCLRAVAAAKR
eukprot:5535117-Lingulodinium_polyedra.AAC.1